MKNLLLVLIAAFFSFAACKKDNEEIEPAEPATLEEAKALIVGKWILVKGVSKYSLGRDTVYTRIWNDSLYQEYSKEHWFWEYVVVNGEKKYIYSVAFGISDVPYSDIDTNYKYAIGLSLRPVTYHRHVVRLTKSTLITKHFPSAIFPIPPVRVDRETITLELKKVPE